MTSLPPLTDTIARHGLATKKSLGQHFLLDARITDRVARAGGELAGLNVIEIGPGPGGLTRSLLQAGAGAVVALEKDARCVAALQELHSLYPHLQVVEMDALEADLPALVSAPRAVVANLPYNVGTPLLLRWLDDIHRDSSAYRFLTLMFQKEVADRIAASPGGKDYGRLSVISQWLCSVTPQFDLAPGAFSPPPKVESSVITLVPRPAPLFPARKEALERVLAAGFNQRRKMLRQSLKSVLQDPTFTLERLGIDPTLRAERLDIRQWCLIAGA